MHVTNNCIVEYCYSTLTFFSFHKTGDTDPDAQDGTAFNHEDLPLHERTAEEKEQMYGKIAQKLICIADTYAAESGMSDAETHGRTAGAQAAAEGMSPAMTW